MYQIIKCNDKSRFLFNLFDMKTFLTLFDRTNVHNKSSSGKWYLLVSREEFQKTLKPNDTQTDSTLQNCPFLLFVLQSVNFSTHSLVSYFSSFFAFWRWLKIFILHSHPGKIFIWTLFMLTCMHIMLIHDLVLIVLAECQTMWLSERVIMWLV